MLAELAPAAAALPAALPAALVAAVPAFAALLAAVPAAVCAVLAAVVPAFAALPAAVPAAMAAPVAPTLAPVTPVLAAPGVVALPPVAACTPRMSRACKVRLLPGPPAETTVLLRVPEPVAGLATAVNHTCRKIVGVCSSQSNTAAGSQLPADIIWGAAIAEQPCTVSKPLLECTENNDNILSTKALQEQTWYGRKLRCSSGCFVPEVHIFDQQKL